MEVIYFELNNWFAGRDFPAEEPYLSWMQCNAENNYCIKLRDKKWIEENKLIVVESLVDMSQNFCITATKEWVEKNCPTLLTTHNKFLRKEIDGEVPYGRFDCPFLEYTEENIGYHYAEEVESMGYSQYIVDYEE